MRWSFAELGAVDSAGKLAAGPNPAAWLPLAWCRTLHGSTLQSIKQPLQQPDAYVQLPSQLADKVTGYRAYILRIYCICIVANTCYIVAMAGTQGPTQVSVRPTPMSAAI